MTIALLRKCAAFCLLAGTFMAAPVSRAQGDPLAINLSARVVSTNSAGQEKFSPADKAKPGDVIQYDAVYQNKGPGALSGLQPEIPIPTGMEFIPTSGKPAPAQGSLDGRKFSALPLKHKVKKADGSAAEENVPAAQIRALRWSVPSLAAGKSTNISVRVRVSAPESTSVLK